MIHGLLTKCEVKMAGHWPHSLWTETKSTSINSQKYPAILTKQTWSIKDLSRRIQQIVTSRQDDSILPSLVANPITRFGLPSLLAELAI